MYYLPLQNRSAFCPWKFISLCPPEQITCLGSQRANFRAFTFQLIESLTFSWEVADFFTQYMNTFLEWRLCSHFQGWGAAWSPKVRIVKSKDFMLFINRGKKHFCVSAGAWHHWIMRPKGTNGSHRLRSQDILTWLLELIILTPLYLFSWWTQARTIICRPLVPRYCKAFVDFAFSFCPYCWWEALNPESVSQGQAFWDILEFVVFSEELVECLSLLFFLTLF